MRALLDRLLQRILLQDLFQFKLMLQNLHQIRLVRSVRRGDDGHLNALVPIGGRRQAELRAKDVDLGLGVNQLCGSGVAISQLLLLVLLLLLLLLLLLRFLLQLQVRILLLLLLRLILFLLLLLLLRRIDNRVLLRSSSLSQLLILVLCLLLHAAVALACLLHNCVLTQGCGLAAGVWTKDISRAHRMASRLNAGVVWVNTYGMLPSSVPFGGFKGSGWGKEGGRDALLEYTRIKNVMVDLT